MPGQVKKFVCIFENGYQAFMGADSKEEALEAVSRMENMARSRIIYVKEATDADIGTYLANAFIPDLPDDEKPDIDDDIEI